MKGKLKYKVQHLCKEETLNLYMWVHPRSAQERQQNKNTIALAEKIRFECPFFSVLPNPMKMIIFALIKQNPIA